MSVSSRCDVYLANATVSCMSTDRRPFVPPLKLLLDSIAECLDLENERIAAERLTGMVQFIMYVQQGVRYFGVSPIPLSHDAYDLLLEMPLLPKPLLDAVVVLYKVSEKMVLVLLSLTDFVGSSVCRSLIRRCSIPSRNIAVRTR
jgi:hypothetical protein